MIRAEALLDRLDHLGVTARVVGRRLGLSPRRDIPAALLEELRAHRDDLITLIEAEERER